MKIFICDDDPGILEVLKIILEESGHQVFAFENGKGIQRKIKQHSPQLIFLDLWMPGIEGREITKILKRDPHTKHIPIIIVSALNDVEQISKSVGADGFLAKPFEVNDLLKLINKHL